MPDKNPGFTVTDRRKFTLEGELREENASQQEQPEAPGASQPAQRTGAAPHPAPPSPQAAPEDSHTHKHVVDPDLEPLPDRGPAHPAGGGESQADPLAEDDFAGEMPEISADETAQQQAAYHQSSRDLDDMISRAAPGGKRSAVPAQVTFDSLVQSIYMTAAIQLGAGTQPGEQPRVDIMGARQSIDMLNVLAEKTKGNLTDKEQRLLQNALFELRMTFLEITNAISSSAQKPKAGGPR